MNRSESETNISCRSEAAKIHVIAVEIGSQPDVFEFPSHKEISAQVDIDSAPKVSAE
jgi:hypothetical protein